jgi:hypothetical protein
MIDDIRLNLDYINNNLDKLRLYQKDIILIIRSSK